MKKILIRAEHDYNVIFSAPTYEIFKPELENAGKVAVIVPADLRKMSEELSNVLKESFTGEILVLEVPEGEKQKEFTVVNSLWEKLGESGFRRNDLIIGLGGGATTDLAGFIAATWLRGIKWIAIPTSLAGMVDAAIGGKTGINTKNGKNLVGSFYSPQLVVVNNLYLKSLPIEEMRAGMAEVIKCGFISDQRILEICENSDDIYQWDGAPLSELIERAIQVKADVVSEDLKESHLREILNYGHTLAHAIERHQNYSWRHGDAVAVGMAFIAELAFALGHISKELVDRHFKILKKAGLPTEYQLNAWPELLSSMQLDKKARKNGMRFVALNNEYQVIRLEGISDDILSAAYEKIAL